ncbi:MAG TPA: ABC transporter ATP-binding protein [Terriglobales bacterium]|jgi:lipopolysaccharide transport system ATP-binding protein|nr:ABC transporter ATP-binding protein [Terriglobales bacterium]
MKPILEIRGISKQYKLGVRRGPKMDNVRELLERSLAAAVKRKQKQGDDPPLPVGSFWALKDVSFNVSQGDVIGIIGRNGAGKSTLLKILSRITSPTSGEVRVMGRMASLLEVGTGFHPELTGRENIFLNGAILGMRKTEITRRFDEIVAFAEIDRFLDTAVKHYSSGMYVRLAFAVAAHLDPEILIVDEVLAVGDLAFQKKCLGKMGEVSRSGRTVLFVSHNMAAVENLCSRAVVLHQGTLEFDGIPKDAIQHYLNTLSSQAGKGNAIDLDRVGTRRVVVAPLLKRMEFMTDRDQPLPEGIPIGGRLKIRVHFDLPNPTDTFNVGLGFDNIYGQRIFTAHSTFEPERVLTPHVGPQVYTCEIPSFTLMPGEYSVKVWLDLKSVQADAIEDAAKITVLESDFYGTGKVPWNGTFVLGHRWYLQQAADAQR